jgi:hypothetical protein
MAGSEVKFEENKMTVKIVRLDDDQISNLVLIFLPVHEYKIR